jgi:membrane associated rhomboid family serine protease
MSVAMIIFVATIAVSLAGLYLNPKIVEGNVFRPYRVARGRDVHTALTSGFVHADMLHLLFNMMTFWFFAFPLERTIGPVRFALLYFLALLVSDVGTFLKHRNDPEYGSLGASGAINAVLFAYILYYPTSTLMILPIPVPIPAPLFAVMYLGYSWWSARQQRGRINHDAHLGGAIFGLAFVLLTDPGVLSRLLS